MVVIGIILHLIVDEPNAKTGDRQGKREGKWGGGGGGGG